MKRKTIVWLLALMAILLVGIGCWFCWHCQRRPLDMESGEFGLVAKRGRILAADGSPLAYTVRKWSFHLDPEVAKFHGLDIQELSREIANGLELEPGDVASAFSGKSRYVFLKDCGEDDAPNNWFVSQRGFTKRAGIICESIQDRVYPLGSAATAVVGFMIRGSHAEKPVGAGGLESACDRTLAGVNGVYDKDLSLKERNERAAPKPGMDIQTTIVPEIQKAVAEALFAACATNGAESAFALVMKVPSGEIAAIASFPTFDPSMRRDLDKWNPGMAVNRASQALFEPGGLVKPLTYAIALDSGVLAEDSKIDQENGAWEYNGVTLRDETTNSLTIVEAIASRANIAAGKTACMVGPEKFHAALRRFGFGSKTCASGMSGEEAGIIVDKPELWDQTTAMRVGMGYGFASTGLQIAQAYATLANHGMLVRPVLVKAVATNSVVQAISPSSADAILRMLKSPMPSTVQMCERDSVTGQTVYSPTNYIASCAGFVPADNPEYVVVVSFSKPQPAHTGEEVAKPAFSAISDAL